MAQSTVTTQVPDAGTPIFDARGYVNPVWHEFFFTLLRRTGGTDGTDTGDITIRIVVLEGRVDDAEKIEYSVVDSQQIPADQVPTEALTHGNQYDPDLHELATTAAAGFMSAGDKIKLNGISPGAGVVSVGGTAPIVSTGGTTPVISITAATTVAAGSLSAADKTKLDGITAGAAVSAVNGTAPIVSSGGPTPSISITAATGSAAGSMSAADKAKLDLIIYAASTWVPTLTMATPGDLNVVYGTREGTYTRIGRMVCLNFVIQTSTFTFTTASGALLVTGVPFTMTGISQCPGKLDWQGITKASYTEIAPIMLSGGTSIQFIAAGSGQARSNVNNANVTSGTQVFLSCSMNIPI